MQYQTIVLFRLKCNACDKKCVTLKTYISLNNNTIALEKDYTFLFSSLYIYLCIFHIYLIIISVLKIRLKYQHYRHKKKYI